jgi:hypothetical protein
VRVTTIGLVELVPPQVWLDRSVVAEVLLAGCSTSTSGMSLEVGCSESLTTVERIWMGGRL